MNKVIFLLVLLLIPLALAQEVYQENTEVDLKQSCYNNGTLCSGVATCNVTVINPERSILVNNKAMTQDSTLAYFNYTLSSSNISKVGNYEYRIVCQDGTLANFGTFEFLVTSSGQDPNISQVIIYAILTFLLIFMFLLSVVGGVMLPGSNEIRDDGIIDVNYMKYAKQILFFISYLLLIGITYFTWQISENLVYLDVVGTFTSLFFYILIYSLLPTFILFMLFTIIMAINDKKIQNAMERGLPIR